jgi:hypothetical protein
MDNHVKEYFSQASDGLPKGNFHKILAISEDPALYSWDQIHSMVPRICKGWYELSKLAPNDRIEFVRDFWLSKVPYHTRVLENIYQFFNSLDNIHVFIIQKNYDDPYKASLVYSLKEDKGFFHGCMGATEEETVQLQKTFPEILPQDYLAFLQIHNGFCKASDTGIIPIAKIQESTSKLRGMLKEYPIVLPNGNLMDPQTLIPFYESFGMPVYQCFYSEWYPEDEMGNVYYSGITHTISEFGGNTSSIETMAFHTFSDWLFFYLERID